MKSLIIAMAVVSSIFGAVAHAIPLDTTADVIFGLENPTLPQWNDWHESMLRERAVQLARAGFKDEIYRDPRTAWSSRTFRQVLLFMYDESFFDRTTRHYRTAELLGEWRRLYGRVDSVLLWQGYPQLGFDSRDQFDFYRSMPGGLEQLKREVSDVLHAAGVRVFIDFNPWDVNGSYTEVAEMVRALEADGVMLDTMTEVPEQLRKAIERVRPGVVFAPERRPPDADLSYSRQSWAQWYDLGGNRPSVYSQKWLVPRHQQFAIRRWDTDRQSDIIYSFFNGSGLLIWDNIYGSWNPYRYDDRRLMAETGAVYDSYAELFAEGEWTPLLPTGHAGLDANLWQRGSGNGRRTVMVFRNRTDEKLTYDLPASDRSAFGFWPPSQGALSRSVVIPAHGVQAVVWDASENALAAIEQFRKAAEHVSPSRSEYDERTPEPRQLNKDTNAVGGTEKGMAYLPPGSFTMHIEHKRRESGCYPFGADRSAMWGWYYEDLIKHDLLVTVPGFAIRKTAVTNAEYLEFVHAAQYSPKDSQNFLKQIPREKNGELPRKLSKELAELPVTFVSLNDARAYAHWKQQRLPTEAEWQWAAEGAGRGYRWPWGNDEKRASDPKWVNLTGRLNPAAAFARAATRQGVIGLTGNAWELTESEYSDGHTRFVLLRGGSYLPPGHSEWQPVRGPRPNRYHAKYILMSDALDRSEAVSFRTVADTRR